MSGLNDVGNLRGRRSPRAPSTRNVKGKSHARRRASTSPHPDTMAAPSYDETAEVEAALLRLPTRSGICKLQHPGPTPSPQARESNRLLSPQAPGLACSGSFQGPSSSLGSGLEEGCGLGFRARHSWMRRMQGGSMHRRDDVSGTWSFEVVDWARGDPRVSIRPTPLLRLRHAASASQSAGRHNKQLLLSHPCSPAPLCLRLRGKIGDSCARTSHRIYPRVQQSCHSLDGSGDLIGGLEYR